MAGLPSLSPGELAAIPPSILATYPALEPPAGVESNFVNPEDRGYIQNSVATVLFCLMVCLFANRVYTKTFVARKASWDDLTCTIGFLASVAVYIVNLWGTTKGPVGKHQWDVRLVDLLSDNFTITSSIIVIMTPFSLLFTKLTFFLLYYEVFRPLRWLRISVYIGSTLTCAFYGATFIAQTVFSVPKPGETWLEHSLSKDNKSDVLSIPLAAVGLGIDIVLLVMPIIAVVGLQLRTKRKIGILFIFMFGIFACVGSLLSLYYRVISAGDPDLTWTIMPVELVGVVELFIGVSCACMPTFSRMVHHHLPALKKFRATLSLRLASLRSSRRGGGESSSENWESQKSSRHAVAKTAQAPYSCLEVETPLPRGASGQPSYELGQLQSVKTFIGKGWGNKASDDQIHLTHEIQQQQTNNVLCTQAEKRNPRS